MGTLMGHLVPGVAFTLLGLWHLLNTINSYKLAGPSAFTSKPWYPLPTTTKPLRRLELHLILSFSLLAIAYQASSSALDGLEHATMFLHLAIYASAALAADLTPTPESFDSLAGALAASAMAQELFLLHFHSADHVGLEGHYHLLLQLAVAASLLGTAATTIFPGSFPVAVMRSAAVMMQGLWFFDMGFALWVPSLAPRGCFAKDGTAVYCAPEAAGRAAAVANLQFSCLLAGVSLLTVLLCFTRPHPHHTMMGYGRVGRVSCELQGDQCIDVDSGKATAGLDG